MRMILPRPRGVLRKLSKRLNPKTGFLIVVRHHTIHTAWMVTQNIFNVAAELVSRHPTLAAITKTRRGWGTQFIRDL
jgi:hypothetical protein